MTQIEIKVTGSGTINQVGIRLYEIAARLLNDPEGIEEELKIKIESSSYKESIETEDDVLFSEITKW